MSRHTFKTLSSQQAQCFPYDRLLGCARTLLVSAPLGSESPVPLQSHPAYRATSCSASRVNLSASGRRNTSAARHRCRLDTSTALACRHGTQFHDQGTPRLVCVTWQAIQHPDAKHYVRATVVWVRTCNLSGGPPSGCCSGPAASRPSSVTTVSSAAAISCTSWDFLGAPGSKMGLAEHSDNQCTHHRCFVRCWACNAVCSSQNTPTGRHAGAVRDAG
jgi:hypothetical protein